LCVVIPAVNLVEIDIVSAEAGQTVVNLGEDGLAEQSLAIGPRPHAAMDLGSDDYLLAADHRNRPDQLGGDVGAVLVELSGLAAVIRFAVIVLPLTTPLTCTALPTGNCCAVLGVRLVPNRVCGVMVTVYAVPFLALTIQVEPFSAAIVPTSPWPWPALPGAPAAGGAVVAGVALELVDPPEHAATPIATEAPTTPTATLVPIRARSQPTTRVIGHFLS
jgi:hypothetical protein